MTRATQWPTLNLGDVVSLQRGFDLPAQQRRPGPFPVLTSGEGGGFHAEGPIPGPGVTIGRATNLGQPKWSESDFWPHNTTLFVKDFHGNHPRWVFHLFESLDLSGYDSGSVQPMLNRNYVARVQVRVPPLDEQRAIAEVLGALDDKIAANAREVGLADDLAATLFEAALAVDSEEHYLGDVATFHNRRRVPLSAVERGARPGVVPYFGAAGRLDYVDEALFDHHLLLVGEDGSVVQGDGRPVTQYIWGPSWVNNHAHVLTGNGITTELLRLAVRRSSVVSLVTGAVQPKISMGNLKTLQLELPMGGQRDLLAEQVDALAAVLRAKTEESRSLAATRDALLPLLMSGTVTVKDAESVVEGVV